MFLNSQTVGHEYSKTVIAMVATQADYAGINSFGGSAMLSAERLREVLNYDRDTGQFRWRDDLPVRVGPRMNGKPAGTPMWDGYIKIKIDGTLYSAHRLAWLYVHGEWPAGNVDHRDTNRANNAFDNLRLATHAQNSANKSPNKSRSPARGVMPHGPGYVARVHHAGKRYYLGYFTTVEAASAAYEAKARELHGDFAYSEPAPQPYFAPASFTGLSFAEMP